MRPVAKVRIGCSRSEWGKRFSTRDRREMAGGGQKARRAEEETVSDGAVWMQEAMARSGTVPGARRCGAVDDSDQHQGAVAAMRAD